MSLFEKLYLGTREEAFEYIIKRYQRQGRCVVSFLYFANVMKWRLLEPQLYERQRSYKKALYSADILLADWIALQLFYRWWAVGRKNKTIPHNLNGSDFNPWFLHQLLQHSESVHISLFTLYDERIGKPVSYIDHVKHSFSKMFGHSLDFVYQTSYQDRMTSQFSFDEYAKSLENNPEYRVLLMCLWTPAQELRIEKNKAFIQKYNILVINAWWTIDYISWFEKRAPQWVVRARVLETPWRIIQQPKKNIKKFLVMFSIVRYWWFSIKNFCISLAKTQ